MCYIILCQIALYWVVLHRIRLDYVVLHYVTLLHHIKSHCIPCYNTNNTLGSGMFFTSYLHKSQNFDLTLDPHGQWGLHVCPVGCGERADHTELSRPRARRDGHRSLPIGSGHFRFRGSYSTFTYSFWLIKSEIFFPRDSHVLVNGPNIQRSIFRSFIALCWSCT